MVLSRSIWTLVCSVILIAGFVLIGSSTPAVAADHLEAPLVRGDGRTDINDVYIFHPGDPQVVERTVISMTVNPNAGVTSPTVFSENAIYDLLIDQNGDAIEDLIFRTTFFSPANGGRQELAVQLIRPGESAELLASGQTETVIRGIRNTRIFAGLRDDPFVFDNNGFNAGAVFCFGQETGENFFAGFNLSTIVIEVPTTVLGSDAIGFWGVTRA